MVTPLKQQVYIAVPKMAYNVVLPNDPFSDNETTTIPVLGKHITKCLLPQPCEVFIARKVIK